MEADWNSGDVITTNLALDDGRDILLTNIHNSRNSICGEHQRSIKYSETRDIQALETDLCNVFVGDSRRQRQYGQ